MRLVKLGYNCGLSSLWCKLSQVLYLNCLNLLPKPNAN